MRNWTLKTTFTIKAKWLSEYFVFWVTIKMSHDFHLAHIIYSCDQKLSNSRLYIAIPHQENLTKTPDRLTRLGPATCSLIWFVDSGADIRASRGRGHGLLKRRQFFCENQHIFRHVLLFSAFKHQMPLTLIQFTLIELIFIFFLILIFL